VSAGSAGNLDARSIQGGLCKYSLTSFRPTVELSHVILSSASYSKTCLQSLRRHRLMAGEYILELALAELWLEQ